MARNRRARVTRGMTKFHTIPRMAVIALGNNNIFFFQFFQLNLKLENSKESGIRVFDHKMPQVDRTSKPLQQQQQQQEQKNNIANSNPAAKQLLRRDREQRMNPVYGDPVIMIFKFTFHPDLSFRTMERIDPIRITVKIDPICPKNSKKSLFSWSTPMQSQLCKNITITRIGIVFHILYSTYLGIDLDGNTVLGIRQGHVSRL